MKNLTNGAIADFIKRSFDKVILKVILIIIMLFMLTTVCLTIFVDVKINNPKETTADLQETQFFDTSQLEAWCEGDCGTVRMVGASYYKDNMLKDEQDNVWTVDDNIEIDEEDFYLLWMDDCNTPDDIKDDVIIKVWAEKH